VAGSLVKEGAQPQPRPAATLVLVRGHGGPEGPLEVLLLRRTTRAVFARGAHVFPGGAVEDADRDPQIASLCADMTDEQASRYLGIASGGLAYWVAAIRESFEEAGILMAYRSDDGNRSLLSLVDPAISRRFARYRKALQAGTLNLLELCRVEQLMLATDRLHYLSHRITPVGPPRRFDTRFFLAVAPDCQPVAHDAAETTGSEWLTPGTALERSRRGQMDILPPQVQHLELLERFSDVEALLEALTGVSSP